MKVANELTIVDVDRWLETKNGLPIVLIEAKTLLDLETLAHIVQDMRKLELMKNVGMHEPTPLERFGVTCLLAAAAEDGAGDGY